MFLFEEDDQSPQAARIKVVGVGGGGCNAVNNMIEASLGGVDFIAANTDIQALNQSKSPQKIQLGLKLTRGLGAGGRPETGQEAALENIDLIREMLSEADMVFVTSGMGGGTGTGAAPVVAGIAKDMGILTIGVVTKPFQFEGKRRARQAEQGLMELKKACHSVIIIPNQRLLQTVERGTTLRESFLVVDDVLRQAVEGISGLITTPGLISVDFADVRAVMSYMGRSVMGMGVSKGENRALEAVEQAISSPLLEDSSIEGAKGVLLNFTGGPDLNIHEVAEAAAIIEERVDPDANIIFGTVISEQMTDEIRVTVIATGFEEAKIKTEQTPKKNQEKESDQKESGQTSRERSVYLMEVAREERAERAEREDKEEVTRYGDHVLDIPTFLRKQAD